MPFICCNSHRARERTARVLNRDMRCFYAFYPDSPLSIRNYYQVTVEELHLLCHLDKPIPGVVLHPRLIGEIHECISWR